MTTKGRMKIIGSVAGRILVGKQVVQIVGVAKNQSRLFGEVMESLPLGHLRVSWD